MKSARLRAVAAGLLVSGLLLTGCAKKTTEESVRADSGKDRKPAPDFTLKDADGRSFKLSDYKGKVVLLNFWATWCGPCKIEIPWFVEFEQKYKDRGFAVLGVSMDEEGWEVVKPYIKDQGINYRMGIGNDEIGTQYGGVESLPTTLIIDRQGRIVTTHVGLVGKNDYQNEITQLLDSAKSSSARDTVHASVGGSR